ncbi:MAG: hypothetical protein PHC92_07695 [Syntrophomonadaceae bacterium]|nr:hypothetical protein [Syntrophomonadaceae bacterium]
MDNFITSTLRLGERVSLVLWLIDQYTALGSSEPDISVFLNGHPAAFQRKAGGYLVFTELPKETYKIRIESKRYLSEEFELDINDLDPGEPVFWVALKPAPIYQFKPIATLIRTSVFDENGQPAPDAILNAILLDDNCARARLGRQGAVTGNQELLLVDVNGPVAPGDLLLIRVSESITGEICEMAAMGVGEAVYQIKNALLADHSRGELLMPVVSTHADERGEAVLYFRNFRQHGCEVLIEATHNGRKQERKVQLKSGMSHILERIIV